MSTSIELGTEELVQHLYSYPNNFNEVGFLEQTLEETIQTWFRSTVNRDGFSASVRVSRSGGRIFLELTGDGEDAYASVMPAYLKAGNLALEGSKALNRDKRWLYDWRFVLPHGLAMIRHRSVQLLHFPPDYVLERDQDYLLAHTTTRWAELLVENGAASDETAQYQAIIDIAPVAAPSDAGIKLEGIYSYYSDYIESLLRIFLNREDKSVRPMVAFGSPVKQWLKATYGLDLAVLSTKLLTVPGMQSPVPVLGANHPSFIYNAAKPQPGLPSQSPEDLLTRSMRVMQQDLIAAGWQVRMAAAPNENPTSVLNELTNFWSNPAKRGRICELTQMQAFNKTPDEAKSLCALIPALTTAQFEGIKSDQHLADVDAELDLLRKQLGPLDGRELDKIPFA